MAVVALKSTQITNRDASPEVINNGRVSGGRLHSTTAKVAIGAADSSTSTYRLVSIPSNAVIKSVKLWTDVSTGANMALSADLYDTVLNGGASVKAGFFKSSIDPTTRLAATDITYTASGAGTNLMSGAEQAVWQNLSGLTVDPQKFYDLVLSVGTNNSTPGCNLVITVDYAV